MGTARQFVNKLRDAIDFQNMQGLNRLEVPPLLSLGHRTTPTPMNVQASFSHFLPLLNRSDTSAFNDFGQ